VGIEPRRIRRRKGGVVYNVASFMTDHIGFVPYGTPEVVDMSGRPGIQVMI